MSSFSFEASLDHAARRLRSPAGRVRADRGLSRLHPRVERKLQELLSTPERPSPTAVWRDLRSFCLTKHLDAPSRATVYNAIARAAPPSFDFAALPPAVQRCLHNVDPNEPIPGHQVVQAAFNAGDVRALSFAAGLPWLCLYRASTLRGFRTKSLSLLRAVMAFRKI